jgi:hypothetical protein
MDVAVELAKCRAVAEKLCAEWRVNLRERIATELLAARADALREFGTPYCERYGPGPAHHIAESMDAEVRNGRSQGL